MPGALPYLAPDSILFRVLMGLWVGVVFEFKSCIPQSMLAFVGASKAVFHRSNVRLLARSCVDM